MLVSMKRKVVYIAHPIGGDIDKNIEKVLKIYRELSLAGEVVPFVPYLASLRALDDSVSKERAVGMAHNDVLFARKLFDELWVYGMSPGVEHEIRMAEENDILVVYKV